MKDVIYILIFECRRRIMKFFVFGLIMGILITLVVEVVFYFYKKHKKNSKTKIKIFCKSDGTYTLELHVQKETEYSSWSIPSYKKLLKSLKYFNDNTAVELDNSLTTLYNIRTKKPKLNSESDTTSSTTTENKN
jgi:hypothetical protein